MSVTTQDERTDQRSISEALWRLLVVIDRDELPAPLAISPNIYGVGDELLRLQVEQQHFRVWLNVIDDRVLTTSEHDRSVHVTVTGKLSGIATQLVCVMTRAESRDIEAHA